MKIVHPNSPGEIANSWIENGELWVRLTDDSVKMYLEIDMSKPWEDNCQILREALREMETVEQPPPLDGRTIDYPLDVEVAKSWRLVHADENERRLLRELG